MVHSSINLLLLVVLTGTAGRPVESCLAPTVENEHTNGSCAEGPEIAEGGSCTAQCEEPYVPTESALSCNGGSLTPATFDCALVPCAQPADVDNANAETCLEGPSIEHGENCTTVCWYGHDPSVESLECYKGVLSPSTFECSPWECHAPVGIENAASPPCIEGFTIPTYGVCTPQCAPRYVSTNVLELSCYVGQLTPPVFDCEPEPCAAPVHVEYDYVLPQDGAAPAACAEGDYIRYGHVCTTQCRHGYAPSNDTLLCEEFELIPPNFSCHVLSELLEPCHALTWVTNASSPSCVEGAVVGYGTTCTPACAYGFAPSEDALVCAGVDFEPSNFSCEPLNCTAPVGIEHAASPSCGDGGVRHGEQCIPQCEPGYTALVGMLSCSASLLTPSSFVCFEEALVQEVRSVPAGLVVGDADQHVGIVRSHGYVDTYTTQAGYGTGAVRHLASAVLSAGKVLICYEVTTDTTRGQCTVVLATPEAVYKGEDVVVSAALPGLLMVPLGTERALSCHSLQPGSLSCTLLRISNTRVLQGELFHVSGDDGLIYSPALAAFDSRRAIVCFQRGSKSSVCRLVSASTSPDATQPGSATVSTTSSLDTVLRNSTASANASEELLVGPELHVHSGISAGLGLTANELGEAVLCFSDVMKDRRGYCYVLSAVADDPLILVARDALPSEVGEGAVGSFALMPWSQGSVAACYSDWHGGETSACAVLSLANTAANGEVVGAPITLDSDLTRYQTLSWLGNGRALVCSQISKAVGDTAIRCLAMSDAGQILVAGNATDFSAGVGWQLTMARVSDDTALICYADTQAMEQGRCRTVWSSLDFLVIFGQPVACDLGSESCGPYGAPGWVD